MPNTKIIIENRRNTPEAQRTCSVKNCTTGSRVNLNCACCWRWFCAHASCGANNLFVTAEGQAMCAECFQYYAMVVADDD
jgi:hypothetical protein